MGLFPRKAKTWPYAADSVGRPRGSIEIGGKIGSIPCYEAVGSAREVFPKLSKDIFSYLEHNLTRLQESDTFVGVSLFMIGRVAHQTKPVVMIVSNDKALRKEAFRSVRDDSGIMKEYPGFDLGHISLKAEFDLKNLQALADILSITPHAPNDIMELTSEEETAYSAVPLENRQTEPSPTVLVGKTGPSTCRRLVVRDSAGSTRTAVGGGLVSYQGRYMFHTVQHFLKAQDAKPQTVPSVDSEETCPEDDSDDCEMTCMSDFDSDYDDDFVDVTSHGSVSPASETNDSAESETDDDETSLSSSFHQSDHASTLHSRLESLVPLPSPSMNIKDDMFPAVAVSVSSQALDSSLVEVRPSEFEMMGLSLEEAKQIAIPLEDLEKHVEMKPRDGAIRAVTPDGGSIGGVCLGTPSYFCLPGSKTFVEVYLAKLNRPLVAGECGTWIRDAVSGKLFGHVVAGSPSTGLAMIVPAHRALNDALESLRVSTPTLHSEYRVEPSSAAYVQFTSGSTGKPKAFTVDHLAFASSFLGEGLSFNDHVTDHMSSAAASKNRLTKEQVMILEAEFQMNQKPSSTTKKTLAELLKVKVFRINNWFQNRRAREKRLIKICQEEEKQNPELEKSPPDPGLHDVAFPTSSTYGPIEHQDNVDQSLTLSAERIFNPRSREPKLSRLYRLSAKQRLDFAQITQQGEIPQPTTEMEFALRDLWAQLLHVSPEGISKHDSFLQIGGDSIAAIQLISLALEQGISLSIADVFAHPQLDAMAAVASFRKQEVLDDEELFDLSPLQQRILVQRPGKKEPLKNHTISKLHKLHVSTVQQDPGNDGFGTHPEQHQTWHEWFATQTRQLLRAVHGIEDIQQRLRGYDMMGLTNRLDPPRPGLVHQDLLFSNVRSRMDRPDEPIPEPFDAWLALRTRIPANPSKVGLANQVEASPGAHRSYQRPRQPRMHCHRCDSNPEGFRGMHELQRHMSAKHQHDTVKYIVDGVKGPTDIQSRFAAFYRTMRRAKDWAGVYYNAAARLRRTHFKLQSSHPHVDVTEKPQIPPSKFDPESPGTYTVPNPDLYVLHRKLCRRQLQFIAVSAVISIPLFTQASSPLFAAGPIGLCASFVVYGAITWAVMVSVAEMISCSPLCSALNDLGDERVNGALGSTMAWGYLLSMAFVIPFKSVAANIAIGLWTDKVPDEAIIFSIIILSGLIHIFSVRFFRTLEYWLGILKVSLMVCLILCTFITTQSKGRSHGDNPTQLEVSTESGGTVKFLKVIYWLCWVSFSYVPCGIAGPARTIVTAGGTECAGKNFAPTVRSVVWRNRVFFLSSGLFIAIASGFSGLDLPGNLGVEASGTDTGAASPYAIVLERLSMASMPIIVNVLIMASLFSTGNSLLFTASRTLHAMSLEGYIPRHFSRSTMNGVPLPAILLTWSLFLPVFLAAASSSATVMTYLVDLVVGGQLVNVASIAWTCFRSGKRITVEHLPIRDKMQVLSRDRLPYRSQLQPYVSYLGLGALSLMLFMGEYNHLPQADWSLMEFFGDCSIITLSALVLVPGMVLFGSAYVHANRADMSITKLVDWLR